MFFISHKCILIIAKKQCTQIKKKIACYSMQKGQALALLDERTLIHRCSVMENYSQLCTRTPLCALSHSCMRHQREIYLQVPDMPFSERKKETKHFLPQSKLQIPYHNRLSEPCKHSQPQISTSNVACWLMTVLRRWFWCSSY